MAKKKTPPLNIDTTTYNAHTFLMVEITGRDPKTGQFLPGNRFGNQLNFTGAAPKYKDVDLFNAKVDEYFDYILGAGHQELKEVTVKDKKSGEEITTMEPEWIWDVKPQRPTITGLCLYLGYCSRQSYYDIEGSSKPAFSYAMKRARMRIETYAEGQTYEGNPGGPIFILKNMGWSDKSEVQHSGTGAPTDNKPPIINIISNGVPALASSEDDVPTEQPNKEHK